MISQNLGRFLGIRRGQDHRISCRAYLICTTFERRCSRAWDTRIFVFQNECCGPLEKWAENRIWGRLRRNKKSSVCNSGMAEPGEPRKPVCGIVWSRSYLKLSVSKYVLNYGPSIFIKFNRFPCREDTVNEWFNPAPEDDTKPSRKYFSRLARRW